MVLYCHLLTYVSVNKLHEKNESSLWENRTVTCESWATKDIKWKLINIDSYPEYKLKNVNLISKRSTTTKSARCLITDHLTNTLQWNNEKFNFVEFVFYYTTQIVLVRPVFSLQFQFDPASSSNLRAVALKKMRHKKTLSKDSLR